jgi:hypothetical protein
MRARDLFIGIGIVSRFVAALKPMLRNQRLIVVGGGAAGSYISCSIDSAFSRTERLDDVLFARYLWGDKRLRACCGLGAKARSNSF